MVERLAWVRKPRSGTQTPAEVDACLATWRQAVGRGDEAAFRRRLAAEAWQLDDVVAALRATAWPADLPLPSWAAVLEDVLAHPHEAADPPTGQPIAFAEILMPFLLVARRRLRDRVGDGVDQLFAPSAFDAIERLLLLRLSDVAGRTLFSEFTGFRASASTSWDRLVLAASDSDVTTTYDAFTGSVREGGLGEIFRHYPVLARLTSRLTELWIASTAELVDRLRRDHEELARLFNRGMALGRVAGAEPGLSDPHHGGRMVTTLTFECGERLVYKPKDIGTEHAFAALLELLNAQGAPLDLRVLRMLVRRDYGWVEYAEPVACADARGLSRYYQRAGMLACLVYVLAGTDCHRENVVASGEHPVLVDAECLLQHRARPSASPAGVHEIALDELSSGVLGTGLLPSWQIDDESGGSAARDISALHTPEDQELVEHVRRWESVNTDAMALRTGPVELPRPRSVPTLTDGRSARLGDHGADILDGFEQGYRFLLQHREKLLAADGPVALLSRQRVRFLFRNTRVYGALHHRLTNPEFMRDGIARSIEADHLCRAMSPPGEPPQDPRWWRLVSSEIRSIEDLDIPYFTAQADEEVLRLEDGSTVDGCLREPSAELVAARLRDLSPADMHRQLGFMAGSLHADSARHDSPALTGPSPGESPGRRPGSVSVVDAALRVADEIAERAVRGTGAPATVTWIAPQYLPRLERYQLQPVAFDLHSGSCGPALFLAAVEAVTGGNRFGPLAIAALQPLRAAVDRSPANFARGVGTGGASGLGSVIYTLCKVAALLDRGDLLDTATRASTLLDTERVATAPLDVFAGLAGEILGLLALHTATKDQDVLDRAVRCGDQLLATAKPGTTGGVAWRTLGGRMLTGFSHGAAGIAYALGRLSAETGRNEFREVALEAIRYEDLLFDRVSGNWPDLREDTQPAFKVNWCHGAPGIGLARLGGLPTLDTQQIRADVDHAVDVVMRLELTGADHLCCGNLGRIELLLAAGLTDEARCRAQVVVDRAAATGSFELPSSLPGRVHMPGFFMGMSGIGYALLRIAHPDVLPSALLWE